MKIMDNVTRFLELSEKTYLSKAERRERFSLRRKLTACGLNPKQTDGLIERAIVFDNEKIVRDYIRTAQLVERAKRVSKKNQLKLEDMIAKLRELGVTSMNYGNLQNILYDLKKNAKAAERQKKQRSKTPHRRPSAILKEEDCTADNDANREDPELDPEPEPYIGEIEILKLEYPRYADDIDQYTGNLSKIDQGNDVSARPINPMPAVSI